MISVYDIPHAQSPAVELSAELSAPFVGGFYTFDPAQWVPLNITTPLRRGLYVVRGISFGSNLQEADYAGAIVELPRIWWTLSTEYGSLFRQPIPLSTYRRGTELNEAILVKSEPCELLARVQGRLLQTPQMVGVAAVKLFVTLTTYEITDDAWIAKFRAGYKPGQA